MVYVNISNDKRLHINNEAELQREIVKYLRSTDLQFTCSLGGCLDTDISRINAYKSGYQKGTCDIMIFTPCSLYSGLALELKTPSFGSGIISKDQMKFLNTLEVESNWFCLVSNDFAEIIEVLVKYINNMLN